MMKLGYVMEWVIGWEFMEFVYVEDKDVCW